MFAKEAGQPFDALQMPVNLPSRYADFRVLSARGLTTGSPEARPALTIAWHNPVIPTFSIVDKLHHAAYIAVGHRGSLVGGNWPWLSRDWPGTQQLQIGSDCGCTGLNQLAVWRRPRKGCGRCSCTGMR